MNENILKKLVSIHSEYPNESQFSDYLYESLKGLGGKVIRQKVDGKRSNILFETGKGHEVLLLGHMDTVPVSGKWSTNPYRLTQKGDRSYGLGAWDMKAGISCILKVLKDRYPLNFKLKVAFVVDEENYSLGAQKLIESGYLDNVEGCISIEPGFIYGERGICLGRIGRNVIDVSIKTKGGHTYLARESENAINTAADFIQKINNLKKTVNTKLGSSNVFPRFIHSEVKGMSIPDSLSLQLEVNTVPPQTSKTVLEEIKTLIKNEDFKNISVSLVSRPTPFCEPYVTDKNEPFVKTVTKTLRKAIKENPIYYYRNSVADENRIAALGIPTLTIGPRGGNAHKADEWVSLKSLNKVFAFLKEFVLTYNRPK